ncbi:MAG: V-type ATP synthase subunit I [Actinobacteria bacterium]|nr:V-type ATP synthase subunit I [Actinomycetota bacterium]
MALEPMKRMQILAHQSQQQQVLDTLQELGAVHLETMELGESLSSRVLSDKESVQIRDCSYRISEIDFLFDFLNEYREDKPGFFKSLVKDKYEMTYAEFSSIEEQVDLETVYRKCSELEREIITARDQVSRLVEERKELADWAGLEVPLDQLKGGKYFEIVAFKTAGATLDGLISEIDREIPESSLEIVEQGGSWAYCLLICHRSFLDAAAEVISGYKNEAVAFPESDKAPAPLMEWIDGEVGAIEARKNSLIERVRQYQHHRRDLTVARDYYVNCVNKIESTQVFGVTVSAFLISGWVPESGVERTRRNLQKISQDIVINVSEPEEGESPPVQLKNNKWMRPFEVLTRLYGLPNNLEYDPTWLIAVSFTVFFGFCIGDVGYGISLVIFFLVVRKVMPLSKNVKDLFIVLAAGSGFAVIMGVLTGSYFGIDPESLPNLLKSAAVFDPLKEPIPLMLVCMAIGVIHMLGGVGVEFRDNWKQGNRATAIIDQGLVIYFFIGTTSAVVLYAAGAVPRSVVYVVPASAVAGMIMLLGHGSKSVPGKVFGGLYETYNTLVGWLGDTVSYLRLFALGLATFSVGWVFNIVGGMVKGIGFGIGIILMLVILLVGHTFNVAINLLGAFVHPLRLEFVEFFGKFYDDGGQPFKPLGIESKQVVIKE